MDKNRRTKAVITEKALGYGPMGRGFTQIITISYQIDNSVYVQKKKLSQRIDKKEIGSKGIGSESRSGRAFRKRENCTKRRQFRLVVNGNWKKLYSRITVIGFFNIFINVQKNTGA